MGEAKPSQDMQPCKQGVGSKVWTASFALKTTRLGVLYREREREVCMQKPENPSAIS